MITNTLTELVAEEGHVLVNSQGLFMRAVTLRPNQENDWQEITLEQKKRMEAKMTVREFMLALFEKGITKEQIEDLKAQNDQVWAELQANYIYRSNPLLDQLCGQFDLTTQDVDDIFGV